MCVFHVFGFFVTMRPMIITYHGSEFIKAQMGDVVVAFNPIGRGSSFKESRFGSDIALVSLNHPDFNGVEQLTYKDKEPFVILGPGEYEVRGIFVKGFLTRSTHDKKNCINTIYTMKFDNINLCHLGALGSSEEMTGDLKEKIGNVDILFVPVSGGDVLEASEASKVVLALSPKVVIPIGYDNKQKNQLDAFLKEVGNNVKPIDKLTIKKNDLLDKEGEIIILRSQT